MPATRHARVRARLRTARHRPPPHARPPGAAGLAARRPVPPRRPVRPEACGRLRDLAGPRRDTAPSRRAATPADGRCRPAPWFASRLLDVLSGRRRSRCWPAGSARGVPAAVGAARARADWRPPARGRTPYVCRCRVYRPPAERWRSRRSSRWTGTSSARWPSAWSPATPGAGYGPAAGAARTACPGPGGPAGAGPGPAGEGPAPAGDRDAATRATSCGAGRPWPRLRRSARVRPSASRRAAVGVLEVALDDAALAVHRRRGEVQPVGPLRGVQALGADLRTGVLLDQRGTASSRRVGVLPGPPRPAARPGPPG